MKRLKAMSNREWVQRHKPEKIRKKCFGGVIGCPNDCSLENYISCAGWGSKKCKACWDLPAKRNGKYIMKVVKE